MLDIASRRNEKIVQLLSRKNKIIPSKCDFLRNLKLGKSVVNFYLENGFKLKEIADEAIRAAVKVSDLETVKLLVAKGCDLSNLRKEDLLVDMEHTVRLFLIESLDRYRKKIFYRIFEELTVHPNYSGICDDVYSNRREFKVNDVTGYVFSQLPTAQGCRLVFNA